MLTTESVIYLYYFRYYYTTHSNILYAVCTSFDVGEVVFFAKMGTAIRCPYVCIRIEKNGLERKESSTF